MQELGYGLDGMEFESKSAKTFSYQKHLQNSSEGHSASNPVGTGFLSRKHSGRIVTITQAPTIKLSGVSPPLTLFTFMNVENNSTLAISELQMRACPPLSGIPEAKDLVPCVCVCVGGWGGVRERGRRNFLWTPFP